MEDIVLHRHGPVSNYNRYTVGQRCAVMVTESINLDHHPNLNPLEAGFGSNHLISGELTNSAFSRWGHRDKDQRNYRLTERTSILQERL